MAAINNNRAEKRANSGEREAKVEEGRSRGCGAGVVVGNTNVIRQLFMRLLVGRLFHFHFHFHVTIAIYIYIYLLFIYFGVRTRCVCSILFAELAINTGRHA